MAGLMCMLLLGCRSSETIVSGTVTVDDQPLERGHVTFYPVDSTKPARGAEIRNGSYIAKQMPLGKFRAVVSETPDVHAFAAGPGSPLLTINPSSRRITPETNGNQNVVEFVPGKQTFNFSLATEPGTR